MYLHPEFICCRRCFFDNWCICTALIFIVADALLGINTSATCFSSNLQILLSLPVMYNCIYILLFLKLADTSHQNFASSIPENFLAQIPSPNTLCILFTSQLEPIHYLQKNWYKKFERIWSERWWHLERKFLCHPLMESEQEFLYQFFVRNVLPLNELNSNLSISSNIFQATCRNS